jgi:hypothetical protein
MHCFLVWMSRELCDSLGVTVHPSARLFRADGTPVATAHEGPITVTDIKQYLVEHGLAEPEPVVRTLIMTLSSSFSWISQCRHCALYA